MQTDQDKIKMLFTGMLGRPPRPEELMRWETALNRTGEFFDVFSAILKHPEFLARTRVRTAWLPGHFYSPIVDPNTVRGYVENAMGAAPEDILGIIFDLDRMLHWWNEQRAFLSRTPFGREPGPGVRYYWRDSPYPIGDAVVYRAMINHLRPARIIEVGAGFSSACALDTLDEIGAANVRLTCIEPYPAALRRLLRASDYGRVEIIEATVQDVPIARFEELSENDILFIDSTHVLKTGSDVHYEFFSVLPRLKPGVMVHFHDIRWPFEYPRQFIFERNFSWNETYALRALLMYSAKFSVVFYSSLFAARNGALADRTFPDFLINPGSAIWIRVNE